MLHDLGEDDRVKGLVGEGERLDIHVHPMTLAAETFLEEF